MAPSTQFPTPRGLFCNAPQGYKAGDLVGIGLAVRQHDDGDGYGIFNTDGQRCRLLGDQGEVITNPLWMMNERPGKDTNCEFCVLNPQEFITHLERCPAIHDLMTQEEIDPNCPDRDDIAEFARLMAEKDMSALRNFLSEKEIDVVVASALDDIAFGSECFVYYNQPSIGGEDVVHHLDATGQVRTKETLVIYTEEDENGEDRLRVASARRVEIFEDETGNLAARVFWEGQDDDTAMLVPYDDYKDSLKLEDGRSRPFDGHI